MDEFMFPIFVFSVSTIAYYAIMEKYFPKQLQKQTDDRNARLRMLGGIARKCITPTTIKVARKFFNL